MTTLNNYYNFSQTPFSRAIPADTLFPSRGHQEIQGRLAFALSDRFPALITGDIGTGKSTAVRAFVHSLDHNLHPLVYLSNPRLNTATLYSQILLALQVEPAHAFTRLLPQLHDTLQNLARKNRYPLLVIDEAHLLPSELFDQLRFLLNHDFDANSLLTLVLVGQPDLAAKLRFAPYQALNQRIAVRYSLPTLDLEETAAYVKHQLKLASFGNQQLFSDSFVASLHDHAKGVPRLINNICRAALLLGATENKQILDETDLKRVLLDLNGQLD
jgi:type II secretory pathway predicted ATPase ExeA